MVIPDSRQVRINSSRRINVCNWNGARQRGTDVLRGRRGVRVTSARIIIGQTTYAMLNITSVMRAEEHPSRLGPVLFLIVGAMLLVAGITGPEYGLLMFSAFMLGIGAFWWKVQKSKYHLRISSASGEANAVTDFDKARIDAIVQAVNEAIIGRG